jgi:very-short-patch-repair endonuclease
LSIGSEGAKERTRRRAERVLASLRDELAASDWYLDQWLDDVLNQVARAFDRSCERWRGLYTAALNQAKIQDRVIRDPGRTAEDRRQAERLRREAEAQLRLLTEVENLAQSDFYSYRYFASEGFLPGYNFPRLPISAYIPGRRTRQREEFLSRPRFLAISEFGPRAMVYHEGSRYIINKVILPVRETDESLPTQRAKLCEVCGYLHPVFEGEGPDLCERCHEPLSAPLHQLFRLQNVSTARRDKINSDEEERVRLGYEIITGVRFAEHGGRTAYRTATIDSSSTTLARLTYGQAATIWRINLGWTRRRDRNQYGFVLDAERGYWAKNEQAVVEDQDEAPITALTTRVIPFVEDTRNCLLLEPASKLDDRVAVSLLSAFKRATQAQYQLEDNELAAEVLPSIGEPVQLLFYESAEGGAGVLKRLLQGSRALAEVAKKALEICHFDPETGEDLRRAPTAREDCEAACYDCLMNYYNQRFHSLLDRQLIRHLLLDYARAQVQSSPVAATRREHLEQLKRLAGSELEGRWLHFLEERQHRLPSKAQALIESCQTRPDFLYEEYQTAVYIDGPPHDFPERQERDKLQTECLEDLGYTVIRFGHASDWEAIIARYPHVFGRKG